MSAGTVRLIHQLSLVKTVGGISKVIPFRDMTVDMEYDQQCDGLIELTAGEINHPKTDVTCIAVYADSVFTVKVGADDETEITTRWFQYNGPLTDLYFSNPSVSEALTLEYYSFTETVLEV